MKPVLFSAGFRTLFAKELMRFWKVSFQTVFAPIVNALLYLVVFAHVLEERVQVYEGVPYRVFLVPGLVMMATLQNAFANSSSSLIQSSSCCCRRFRMWKSFWPTCWQRWVEVWSWAAACWR